MYISRCSESDGAVCVPSGVHPHIAYGPKQTWAQSTGVTYVVTSGPMRMPTQTSTTDRLKSKFGRLASEEVQELTDADKPEDVFELKADATERVDVCREAKLWDFVAVHHVKHPAGGVPLALEDWVVYELLHALLPSFAIEAASNQEAPHAFINIRHLQWPTTSILNLQEKR